MPAYEAIIDGSKVTWVGDPPTTGGPQRFRVELEPLTDGDEPNGAKLARMMRAFVAETGGIKSIEDPAAWQREIREDCVMPGREP